MAARAVQKIGNDASTTEHHYSTCYQCYSNNKITGDIKYGGIRIFCDFTAQMGVVLRRVSERKT